jgi:hypothetical protein
VHGYRGAGGFAVCTSDTDDSCMSLADDQDAVPPPDEAEPPPYEPALEVSQEPQAMPSGPLDTSKLVGWKHPKVIVFNPGN